MGSDHGAEEERMALHMGPPVTPVVAICGPRGSDTSQIADWMREAFECRNPVISADDFFKVSSSYAITAETDVCSK